MHPVLRRRQHRHLRPARPPLRAQRLRRRRLLRQVLPHLLQPRRQVLRLRPHPQLHRLNKPRPLRLARSRLEGHGSRGRMRSISAAFFVVLMRRHRKTTCRRP